MNREELIEKVVSGTNRERERRGFTQRVTREVYEVGGVDDALLTDLAAEIDLLDKLYASDRAAWERYAEQRLAELGAIRG